MNRLRGMIMSCFLLLPLGCSDNHSSYVVFDGFGNPPLRCVAKVGADGTFKCEAQRGGRWDTARVLYHSIRPNAKGVCAVTYWLKGTVRPAGGGTYSVSFCIEERAYTSIRLYFPYEAYTKTCTVRPDTEFVVTPGDTVTLRINGASNPAGAVDAPMSSLFHRVRHRRRATDQQR